jgi:aspartyl-tRNA(Asn)/glutamyl-tRNA(Gln) amidotransferase subunit C
MSLTLDEVRRIARLARLRRAQLGELDVSQVEPMTHALAAGEVSPLREDVPLACLSTEEALANAPAREGSCFKVPRIIE